jgi:hypothetical protein
MQQKLGLKCPLPIVSPLPKICICLRYWLLRSLLCETTCKQFSDQFPNVECLTVVSPALLWWQTLTILLLSHMVCCGGKPWQFCYCLTKLDNSTVISPGRGGKLWQFCGCLTWSVVVVNFDYSWLSSTLNTQPLDDLQIFLNKFEIGQVQCWPFCPWCHIEWKRSMVLVTFWTP